MKKAIWTAAILLVATGLVEEASAANPPALINYQGVLRDSAGEPLTGTYDLVFRFFSGETAGEEILVDAHTTRDRSAVDVTGGMFNTILGGGSVADGSGAGTYTTLAAVFRDYGTVYLSIEINREVLTPRIRITSAAYAHNATNLGGRPSSGFVDTSSTGQTKAGPMNFDASTQEAFGVTASGLDGGAHFTDSSGTSESYLAKGSVGVIAYGTGRGGSFVDTSSSGYAYVADGDRGITAVGDGLGGYFSDGNDSGYAAVAHGDRGITASGSEWAGYFDGNVKVTEELRVAEIHTGDLTVEVDWPDYVFEDGYDMMSLEALAAYIEAHGHLPGIPSADEVRDSGVSIGKTQALLLQKIEELSLHLIAQEERLNALERETERLRAEQTAAVRSK